MKTNTMQVTFDLNECELVLFASNGNRIYTPANVYFVTDPKGNIVSDGFISQDAAITLAKG